MASVGLDVCFFLMFGDYIEVRGRDKLATEVSGGQPTAKGGTDLQPTPKVGGQSINSTNNRLNIAATATAATAGSSQSNQ